MWRLLPLGINLDNPASYREGERLSGLPVSAFGCKSLQGLTNKNIDDAGKYRPGSNTLAARTRKHNAVNGKTFNPGLTNK